jgi:hypothetical protein
VPPDHRLADEDSVRTSGPSGKRSRRGVLARSFRSRWPAPLALAATLATLACGADKAPAGEIAKFARSHCSAKHNAFRVGRWPGACWRPYSAKSPFNRPIRANAKVDPSSDHIVRRLLGFGPPNPLRAGIADTDNDYYHPTYYGRPSDPLYTIRGGSDVQGFAVDGRQVRVPAGARPAGGSDHHMTIIYGRHEYGFWEAQVSGRTINVSSGRKISLGGSGLAASATAARFGGLAGVIRAPEMEAGRINLALFMAVNCTDGRGVFPAAQVSEGECDDPRDAPSLGTRFQLNMSNSQINALKVPRWKKTILTAMARYGMYVGDVTGSPWTFQFESGSTYTSFGYQDAMVTFAKRAGVPRSGGAYVFNLSSGVNWARYLRVIAPPRR